MNREHFSIAVVWLFHLSAILGIYLGFKAWFLPKTPLNLLVSFALLIWVADLTYIKNILVISVFFVVGMFAEWLGVKFGWLFGNYVYGENLGLKLDGVPYIIGINWAMLVLITGAISTRISEHILFRVFLGASLMLGLDILMELNASSLDFWHFKNAHIPLKNYIAWFAIGFLLHIIYQKTIQSYNFKFSLHLYLAQLLFFLSFHIFRL